MSWIVFHKGGFVTSLTEVPRPIRSGESKKVLESKPDQERFRWNAATEEYDIPKPILKPLDHPDNDRVRRFMRHAEVAPILSKLAMAERTTLRNRLRLILHRKRARYGS